MKNQWKSFLESRPIWPYGIVPSLVNQLDNAIRDDNQKEITELIRALAMQGVVIDQNGDLCYAADVIFEEGGASGEEFEVIAQKKAGK